MKYVKIEGGKKLSSFIEPMKAQPSTLKAFDSPEWVFEIKWDGYRAIAEIQKSGNKLYSRNGLTFDKAYPAVFNALKVIQKEAILDGEIVVYDETGKPSFQKLQNYRSTDKYPIQFVVFDILRLQGKDLTSLTLLERKAILQKLLPKSDIIKFNDHVDGEGKQLWKELVRMDLEGMIAKKKASLYSHGKRSADWLKIKNIKTQEAIIVGYTSPKGLRNYFGSLILGVMDKKKLVCIGNVGTGFTEKNLKDIHSKLKTIERTTSPLDVPIKQTKDMFWVEPDLVCNITFSEITTDKIVRHPVFQGIRIDKGPKDVTLD
ncbi:MAG: non-homologous end-joining DNA ligase [Chryseolinea sp.]